jgi:DNA helicase HerA-like ATPase
MFSDNKAYVANAQGKKIYLLPHMTNRHGLITGATGTGKTVTMKVLAESFSDMGVPVFLADVKGDVSGLAEPGVDSENMQKRIDRFDLRDCWRYHGYPVAFWDIFGEKGIPIRIKVSDMGPLMFSRLLGLTEVQTGILHIVYRVADDNGLELIDLKDLRAMLTYVAENRASLVTTYGNVTAQSIGAIQRALLRLEDEGGNIFFGEPSISIEDLLRVDQEGLGILNILDSTKLIRSPLIYSTFLIWLVSELFERLPEVGDPEKPKAVFFFDEAHLLFQNAPKAFLEKIVQLVKLIRSKGVGIYFVSQSPSDISNDVLAQLSNRIQHGLRAYTPSEMKAVRAAANSFRPNPALDTEKEILSLGTGEALVSLLDEKGIPTVVERANILPPQSLMAPAQEETRQKVLENDPLYASYQEAVDRYSAYEKLKEESDAKTQAELAEAEKAAAAKQEAEEKKVAAKKEAEEKKAAAAKKKKQSAAGKAAKKVAKTATNSILSKIGRKLGKAIARGIFGNWL